MTQPARFDRSSKQTVRIRRAVLFGALFCGAHLLVLFDVLLTPAQVTPSSGAQSGDSPGVLNAQPGALAGIDPDAPLPSFEVASIKKHVPDNGPGMRIMMGGPDVSQFRALNVTAKMLIAAAYGVREFQISGGPGWINSDRFDIEAKVEDSVAAQLRSLPRQQQQAQQNLMLRSLLSARFDLQVRRNSKEGTVLALVVAKGGPKLKQVPPPDPQQAPGPPVRIAAGADAPGPPPGATTMMMNRSGVANLSSNGQPISNLVNLLAAQLGQQVVDETGLKGTYQYSLQFASQGGVAGMPPPPGGETAEPNSDAPSIFSALQDQLGLKLESRKGAIDAITIDHIEEPSEN
jgi:bla regulator protein blaR1